MASKAKKPAASPVKKRIVEEYAGFTVDSEEEEPAKKKKAMTPAEAADAEDEFAGLDDDTPWTADGDGDDKEDEPVVKPRVVKTKTKGGKIITQPAGKGVSVVKRRIVAFENRKLTKKAETQLEPWKIDRHKAVDSFFKSQAAKARTKFGNKAVYVGSESENLVVCIPMFGGHGPEAAKYPGCLPMEFVFCQDGFPLGIVIQMVAKPGVGKSGLLAEFGRWFFLAGGGLSLKEAESKFNPQWYQSIMGSEFFAMMPLYRCGSVEDWQRKLTFSLKSTKDDMVGTEEKPGPGRTVPVCFGIDSIMGKASEETQEQILGAKGKKGQRGKTGDGSAGRGYPIEALKITRYLRTIPGELDEWPFTIVLVNHLRINKTEDGLTERSKAGGEQVNFQESYELELQKIGGHKKKIECADFEGFPVQISCEKNSFGPTHRRIQTRVLWWDEKNDETGNWEQRTIWDWDWSTVHLLYNIMHGERANPRLKQALIEIDFHLACPKTSDIENCAWSKSLGMTSEKEAMPWTDVGALIREDADLMDKLRRALRITRRPLLQGDYLELVDELKESLP